MAHDLAQSVFDTVDERDAVIEHFRLNPRRLPPVLHPEFDRLFLEELHQAEPEGGLSDAEWLQIVEPLKQAAREFLRADA